MSEQERAEALGKRIEDLVCDDTWNGDWDATRREYAALIEADRAATRKDERRKALEDACLAECPQCASDGFDHESIYEHDGCWYHDCGGAAWICKGWRIRALMEDENDD